MMGSMAVGRHGGWIWVLRAHTLSYKHETERAKNTLRFETLKSTPSDASPNPAQTALPTGSQVSKIVETVEDISLKSPQEPSGNL